jgi:hypothetical protein
LKDTVFKLRALYTEKVARGHHKVTYPSEQGDDGRRDAEKLLRAMEESVGMAVPSDLSVELVNWTVAPDEIFERFIARCDKEIVLGLQGAVLQMVEGSRPLGTCLSGVHGGRDPGPRRGSG